MEVVTQSKFGIASFVVGVVVAVAESVMAGTARAAAAAPGGIDEASPRAMTLLACVLVGLLLAFVGMLLGVAGILQPDRRRAAAVVGLLLNGLAIAVIVAVIGIGMGE
jgi:hypothetical protein